MAIVLAIAGGCALSPEQCDDNYDQCEQECSDADDEIACVRTCGDEYGSCLDAAEAEDERVEGTFEVLEILFGDDDDEC